jgi:hypothetical protein
VIAEAAGLLVGALAFPWFGESERWAEKAASVLEAELVNNTFPSGLNREMAFEYHGFVAELALVAGAEADLAGRPMSESFWNTVRAMLDAGAAVLDRNLRGPRYGDGDDGKGLVIGPRDAGQWAALLAAGRIVFGTPDWWPTADDDPTGRLLAALITPRHGSVRPRQRPSHFADAGLTLLRTESADGPEIWCRCDAGPHGFLAIAAHGHADALSVEVRRDGVDILADPGTYCYHGETAWRRYFRSTLGHNTVEIGEVDQSLSAGPFLWARHANSRLLGLDQDDRGHVTGWRAEHDGYANLTPSATHRRQVHLLTESQRVEITDEILTAGPHPIRMAFHLGPQVAVRLVGTEARLSWTTDGDGQGQAALELPVQMRWSAVSGSTQPVMGWFSPGFGKKEPATTLLGEVRCDGPTKYETTLQFLP